MRSASTLGLITIGCLIAGCGSGAASGGSGSSGGDAGDPSGAKFPFPQNKPSARCAYPTHPDNADVKAAYDIWKQDLVTADGAGGFLRVRRPDTPDGLVDSTVSEGIAYGMIIAVYMNDQAVFDGLWRYERLWIDGNGLMNWYIDPTGTKACPDKPSCGAATDSDEDMAFALVLADRQWGGKGSLDDTYLSYAKEQIDLVWKHEVEGGTHILRPGDTWGGSDMTNPSYFAPAYYRVFGAVSGNVDGWSKVIDTNYPVLLDKTLTAANKNAANGLVPAWCDGSGTPKTNDALPPRYQYDAARTPFRVAQDYCWNGAAPAKAYLDKIDSFFTPIGPDAILDGYDLDGTPHPEASMLGSQSAVFVGAAGVGAMSDAANQAFIDGTYKNVATLNLLVRSRYYQRSWTAMTLLMMSGNFLDYTQAP